MDDSKKIRMLLLIVLLLSAVCSLSLALATYTHITGELPFDLEAHAQFRDETYGAAKIELKAAELPIQENSIDEVTLRTLHKEMKEKEQTLISREERVVEKEGLVKSLLLNAETSRKKTVEVLESVKKERADAKKDFEAQKAEIAAQKQSFVDSKKLLDTNIVKKISSTLESMQPLTSMLIINDLEIDEASRLLNAMSKEKRAQVLSQMIEVTQVDGNKLSVSDKINFRRKANEIIRKLRELKVEPQAPEATE
ncbi:MAG: hypothetical protein NE334_00140 [Lentisphaeraceae bacterium]|nr:hypothetical protein [Lentisphaeraceae bacterium]